MRLLVVGAGSTGGYFGGRLVQAGRDVTFLVRPGRAAQLRSRGLEIVSPHGDVTLHPQLVTADEVRDPYDAILLTVKNFSLQAALDELSPAVGPNTVILPVLNGMRHVDVLKARFGVNAVGGCTCKVMTVLDDAGRVVQLTGIQDLAYGELDGRQSERMQQLDRFMTGAGFDAKHSTTIVREMWEKWLLLASMGGITCSMRGNLGQVEAAPGGRDFILNFIDEVAAVISSVGVPPSDAVLSAARELLSTKGSTFASSMYRDLERGLPIEADDIIGDLLQRGRDAGIATPLLAAAYTHLCVYMARRQETL
jgi:2-dehydropantoate 2-reductase